LIAPFLEIQARDLAENAGEATVDLSLFAHIGRLQQIASDLGRGRRRHLLDADHQHDAGAVPSDRLQSLVDGGRASRAGILDPRGALEPQLGRSLQHQRGGKILCREASVKMPEDDLVDVLRRHTGVA